MKRLAVLPISISLFTVRYVWFVALGSPISRDVSLAVLPGLQHPYLVPGQAPYGVLWYAMNMPIGWLSQNSPLGYISIIMLLDLPLMMLLPSWKPALFYAFISLFEFNRAPWNLPVMWLLLLGYYRWPFLLAAIATKLPVGAPLSTWTLTGNALFWQHNYYYWGGLAALFCMVWILRLQKGVRRGISELVGITRTAETK